jgi:hypothetical protein
MSKLYNKFNIEEEILGKVYELPKKEKEIKPFDLIMNADNFIFNSILNK